MSLRKRPQKKQLSESELNHLRDINNARSRAEIQGISQEHASKMAEEVVFFKKGDAKGKAMSGGETEFKKISDIDPSIGTVTELQYRGKDGRQKVTQTMLTKDKKLINSSGDVIRELY